MKKETSKLKSLIKLIKENNNRIKRAAFNSKNGFYLFVLAGSYACSSDGNKSSSLSFIGSDSVDFLGDTSSTSNQIVDSAGGNDFIITGAGDDIVRGGQGSDFISTGVGNDTILIIGTTATDEYSSTEIEDALARVLSLETLNGNIVDEAASDIIDGGDGIDTLMIYGATDLTGTTITNIENISIHSTVTVDEDTFDGSSVVLRGDGSSVLVIEGDVSLTDVLGEINDFSGFASIEIGDGATVIVTSPDEVNLLAEIGVVSGSGTLTINGTETLSEVTVVPGVIVNGSNTNLSDVLIINGTFSLEEGSMTNINTDAVNLVGASTTTAGFHIDENGQLLITDASLTGRQLVVIDEFDHDENFGTIGISVRYTIVLPKLDIAPTQADFDSITFDELDEGVNLDLSDALSTALLNLDPVFVLTKTTASNGTVDAFSYNSGEFSGTDTITFSVTNIVTGEEFDFTEDLDITAVNDDGIIQITGNRQQGETLTAELIDLDGGVTAVTYAWSQGAVRGGESSFNIGSSTDDLELIITYRDAVNPSTDQTATITIAADDILAEDIDTQIALNLDADSTAGIVIFEDSNNSDGFVGLNDIGNFVNIATNLAYTTATISLVDDGSGGEQINFEYTIDREHSGYIALAEGEELVDSITLTTRDGVSLVHEFTVVGENDAANFDSQKILTVNDTSEVDKGTVETQNYAIIDADGIEQENLVLDFGLVATSGTLGGEAIASADLAAYGNLNVNSITNELSFLKGERVDVLEVNEEVVLTFSVNSIDQTALLVTVRINGANDEPVIVNDEITIAEDSGLVVISVLDNDSDTEGNALTVTEVTGANNGTVIINDRNQLEYIADADFFGTETLTYTVADGVNEQTGTVRISVTPVNDQGELIVAGSVAQGSTLSVSLIDVDGIDGSNVTLSLVDGNGNFIEDFIPVVVEGSGNTVTTTVVVPTSVIVGSEIVLRASYVDTGGVAYGASAPFISTESLTVLEKTNTPPTIGGTIPADITVIEDTASPVDLSSIEFIDIDGNNLVVTLTASTGTFIGKSEVSGVRVVGTGTNRISLTGSLNDLNNYLDITSNIEYTGVSDIEGDNAASFTIVVNDGFLDFSISTINLDIIPVNDAPTIGGTVPIDITVTEDTASPVDLSSVEFVDIDGDDLTVSLTADSGIFAATSSGEVTVGGSGGEILTLTGSTSDLNNYLDVTSNIEYTGASDIEGDNATSFTIVVNDGTIASSIRTINLDINSVNDAPVALDNQTATISEDSLLTVSPNASDVDGDILTLTVDNVSNGTATVDVNGDIVFTPTVDFNGEAIISYTAGDGSLSDTGVITVTVTADNDAPVALDNQTATISEDSLLTVSPNASDVDLDILTLTVDNVSNGTATVDVNGDIVFTPTADFNGEAIISYTASDDSVSDTGIITVTVTAENDAPVALDNQTATISEDSLLTVSPNASDVDGDILSITVDNVSNGTATVDMNGDIVFTPTVDFNGEAIISYTAGDGSLSDTGVITVTVTADNDAPVALDNQTATISEDSLLTVSPNASDVDLDILTLTVDNVSNGTATVDVNGDIVFTPTADFNGEAIISYTASDDSVSDTGIITITVTAENDAPVALDNQTATISEDSLLTVSPNASDVDGDILSITVDNVSNGTATVDVNGDIVFTPTADFNGEAIISYTASDDSVSDTGIITVTVTAENDAPVALDNQTATISEDSLLTVSPNASDVDLDILSITVDNVSNGTATEDVNGDIVFTPTADFNGEAIISYTASDDSVSDTGIITITVIAENDAPVALDTQTATISEDSLLTVSPNASDVDLDILSITVDNVSNGTATEDVNGDIVFTPTADFNGEAIISYTASDDSVFDTGIITVTVTAENDAPVALDNQTATISEDSLLTVSPNASDVDLDILSITVDNVSNGTATVDVNGDIVFTPTADFNGEAIISYTASDDSVSDTGIITITVIAENDAPVALDNQTATISEDSLLTVSPNASDVDLDILSITVDNVSNGTATVDVNGDIVFTPTADFNGEAIISYTASDDSVSDTGIITITVTAENDAPVALDDQTATISEDSLLTVSPNASDVDLDILSITVDNVSNGTATVDVNGDIVFTPTADFNGEAIISYTASDDSVSDTGIITVTVTAENDAPVALDDQTATISEDSLLTVSPNASDVDLDILSITVDNVSNGTATVDVNGDIVFTPTADFNGEAIISYTASDDSVSDTGIITVTVTAENDAPVALDNQTATISEDSLLTVSPNANDVDLDILMLTVDNVSNGTATVDVNGDIVFTPTADFNGEAIISYTASDDSVSDTGIITVTVTAENDAPIIGGIIPTDIIISDDTATEVDLSLVEFSDVEDDNLTVILTASVGTFSAVLSEGVSISGVETGQLILTGSVIGINEYLDTSSNIKYTNDVNGGDVASFTITANDGSLDSLVRTANLNIETVNDAPIIGGTVPTDITVTEDTASPLDLSSVVFADIDSGNLTVSLTADSGIFTATSIGEVIVEGSGSEVLTLSGSVSAINDYLDTTSNIEYTGGNDIEGDDTASFTITANDGSLDSVVRTVNLDISPVNDAPIIGGIIPTDITISDDTATEVDLSLVEFSDVEDDNLTVILTASVGTFSAVLSEGVSISGIGTGQLTLTGSVIGINEYLDTSSNIKYTNDVNGGDVASFTIVANDGSLDSLVRTVNLNIGTVNDAPTIGGIVPMDITVTEDMASPVDLSSVEFSDIDSDNLTVSLIADSGIFIAISIGEVTVGGSGSEILTLSGSTSDLNNYLDVTSNIEYTGEIDIEGNNVASFMIVANDGSINSLVRTVNIDISSVNDAPVALDNQTATISEDSLLTVSPNANDVDLDILTLTVDNVSNGTATVDVNGDIVFTPTADFNGEAIISYTASDDSVSDTGIITVTVTAENDAPVALDNQTATISEDSLLTVSPNANDVDLDILTLTVDNVSNGTATVDVNGDIVFTPTSDFNGEVIISYTASDDSVSDTGIITVTVTAENDAPVALDNQTATISEDSLLTVSPNASDVDLDILSITVDNVSNGTATVDVNGDIVFTPTADFDGEAIISYTASDDSVSDTGIITVTVTAENDAPVALDNQTATISEDSLLTVSPNANDVDLDILTLTVDNVSNGTATVDVNGDIVFTPTADFNGEAIISYTASDDSVSDTGIITVTVTVENDAPVALDNQTATISEDSLLTVSPNASDVDLDILTLTVDNVSNGTATVDVNGDIVFTPTSDFNGEAIISYTASDDSVSDTGIITVTVTAENDAPVALDNQTATISEDSLLTVSPNANDVDLDILTLTVDNVSNGTATVDVNGDIVFTPTSDFNGEAIISYTASDDSVSDTGIITVTVTAENDAPVALDNQTATISEDSLLTVSPNASDVDLDILTITVDNVSNGTATVDVNGDIVFTPTADFNGEAIISYTASDDSMSDTGIITVTVTAENDAPVALDNQTATISEDSLLTVSPNASDVDLDILTITVDNVSNGTATVDVNGDIVFTPTSDFNGEAIISYTASDDSISDTGIITVTVTAENDAPRIGGTVPTDITVTEDRSSEVDLSSVELSDIDSDNLTISLTADSGTFVATSSAEVIVGGSGEVLTLIGNSSDLNSYLDMTSNIQYIGENTASFTIVANDGMLDSSISTVNVDITGINDEAQITGASTGTVEISNVPELLDATITSSTGNTDTRSADLLRDANITLDNYLTLVGGGNNWVTNPSGSDYFVAGVNPVLTVNFGSIQRLSSILVWGHSFDMVSGTTFTHSVREFELEYLNSEGVFVDGGTYNFDNFSPSAAFSTGTSLEVILAESYMTSQVRLTITDNYFGEEDNFSYIRSGGGERVGLNELAFVNRPNLMVIGDLNHTDVDNTDDIWQEVDTASVSAGGYGTYTIDVSGNWTYIVDTTNTTVQALGNGEILSDTFTALTEDNTQQIVTITINGANDAPVALDDQTATISEDSLLTVSPNASDIDGDILSITVDNVSNGTATVDVNGDIIFTPTADFNGEAIISYTASDDSVSDTGIIMVTVTAENDAPTIDDDVPTDIVVIENMASPVDLSGINFTDVDEDILTLTLDVDTGTFIATTSGGVTVGGAGNVLTLTGTASNINTYLNTASNVEYTSALNVNGNNAASFTIVANDGILDSSVSTVNVDIARVGNDEAQITGATTGTAEITNVPEILPDGTITIMSPSGDFRAVSNLMDSNITIDNYSTTQNRGDIWTTNANGSSIDYFVAGENPVITVDFGSVQTLNTILVWAQGIGEIVPHTAREFDVEILNSEGVFVDGGTYNFDDFGAAEAFSAGTSLEIILSQTYATSQVRLTITDNYAGLGSLSYVESNVGNRVALGELAFANLYTPITGDLNHTDVDIDNADDVWQVVDTATASLEGYGTYTIDTTGNWTYILGNSNAVADAIITGQELTDSFIVLTEDGTSQLVNITINMNNAPTIDGTIPTDITVIEDRSSEVDLSSVVFADIDGDDLTVSLTADSGIFTATSSAEVIVGGSGSQVLTLSGSASDLNEYLDTTSNIEYTGASNENGESAATFTIVANDGTGYSVVSTVNLDISPVNDAPTIGGIVPVDITVTKGTASPVDLSSVIFSDIDSDELVVSLRASTGTFTGITGISGVEVIGSGTDELILIGSASTLNNYLDTISNIAYTGASDIEGENAASFTIVANDGSLELVESIVNLDIIPLNNTPTIDGIPIDITVIEDMASPVDLSSVVFADIDGDDLTVSLTADSGTFTATGSAEVTVGGSGSEVLTLSGSASDLNEYLDITSNIEYTGASDIEGENAASFTIVVNDGFIDSVVSTVNLDISSVNDAPTIGGIPTDITVTKGVASIVDLSSVEFSDIDSDELTVTLTADTGTFTGITGISGVEVIGSGTDELILIGSASTLNNYLDTISNIAYTGASDIEGENAASFTIVANDGSLELVESIVNLDIIPLNNTPTIDGIPIDITVIEDMASPVDLSSVVFADIDGDDLTVSLTADSGTFTATGSAEVTVGGSGSEVLTLSGSASDLNEYLDITSNIEYTGASDIEGEDAASFTIVVNDGFIDSVVSTVNLDISSVNDAPTIGGIPTDITVTKGVASIVDLSSVEFSDIDSDELTVTLTADSGTFTATSIGEVTVGGSGSILTLTGSTSNLSNYLGVTSNIEYTGANNENGDNVASFTIVANDGSLDSLVRTVNIHINPVGAPRIGGTVPVDIIVTEDMASPVDLSLVEFSDIDSDELVVSLTASTGTFTGITGISGVQVFGSGTDELILIGSASTLNNYLDTISNIAYTGASDIEGDNAASFTIVALDGSLESVVRTVNIDISPVNDAPTIGGTIPTNITVIEDRSSEVDLSLVDFSDIDSDNLTVSLTADTGTFVATSSAEVIVGGSGSELLTLTGNSSDLNSYLDTTSNIEYIGSIDVEGDNAASFTIVANDEMLDSSISTVNVDITGINDEAQITGASTGTAEISNVPEILPDGTITIMSPSGDLRPVSNIVDGDITIDNYSTTQTRGASWTTQPNGNANYFFNEEYPVITFDFGSAQTLNTILVWSQDFSINSQINAHTAREFDVAILNSDGNFVDGGTFNFDDLGASEAFSSGTSLEISLPETYTTSQVRLTITDNYHGLTSLSYVFSGGGNRVGLGELAFANLNDTSITGDLNHTDVDVNNADDIWQEVDTASASIEGYGTYTIDVAGNWTYIVGNSNAVANAISTGQELTDSFTVYTEDGTSQLVTVTIARKNDTPIVDGIPTDITVIEDTASPVDLSEVVFSDIDGDDLTVSLTVDSGIFTATSSGEVTVGGSGSELLTLSGSTSDLNEYLDVTSNIQYTGASNENGESAATFTIVANDGTGDSVVSTVNLDISPVNDAPTIGGIVPVDITVTKGTASPVDLSSVIFSDIDSDELIVSLTASTGTFTGITGISGVEVIGSGTDELILIGSASTLNNYLDTISNIAYTGASNIEGDNAASFTIVANDGSLESVESIVNIDIIPVNNTPTVDGIPTDITVIEDTASLVDLSSVVFSDIDGDELTVTLTADSGTFVATSSGEVTVGGSGSEVLTLSGSTSDLNEYLDTTSNIAYTGASNIEGDNAASFTIVANDGFLNSLERTVNLDISPVNDAPTVDGIPTDITVIEDTASPVDLSSVDFVDIDGDDLTVTLTADSGIFTATSSAEVIIGGSGSEILTLSGSASAINEYLDLTSNIAYTGASDIAGENVASFTIIANDGSLNSLESTVNLDISPVNDTPVALDDQTATISEDSLLTVSPNASDVDLDILTLTVDNVSNGTARVDVNGDIVFTPTADFNGEAVISYTASDDSVSDTGIITVTVTAENDAPTVGGIPTNITVTEDRSSEVDLSSIIFSDVDGDELVVSLTASSGIFTGITGISGVEVFGSGTDELILIGSASTLNNYLDTISNIAYIGASNIEGDNVASFTIVANDGFLNSLERTVNLDISPVNDAPTVDGIPIDITVIEDTASPVDLSSVVFADVDGDELVVILTASSGIFTGITGISGVEVVGSGTSELILTGSVSALNSYLGTISNIAYTGASDIEGDNAASFTIVANDGVIDSSISTVNIDIAVNEDAEIIGDLTGTAIITNVSAILPDGTITSSTNSSDRVKIGGGNLSEEIITLDNYLTSGSGAGNWATDANPSGDYFRSRNFPNPVLMIDFGSTETFNTILVWGLTHFAFNNRTVSAGTAKVFNVAIYDSTNVEADDDGFVTVATGLDLENFNAATAFPDRRAVELSLSESYTTSQVRLTITDNYFGFNSLGYISSVGSWVGLGELAFANLNDTSITGDLNHTDVDIYNADDVWQVVEKATASIEGYGTYTIDATGNWTYILDDSSLVVDALNNAETLTDTFTAYTEDGTSQLVTVTINVNNAPIIGGTVPIDIVVIEDTVSPVDLSLVDLSDIDSDNITLTLTADTGIFVATSSGEVTVGGSGSDILSLSGSVSAINEYLDVTSNIEYTGAGDIEGDNAASFTIVANDGFRESLERTVSLDISSVNDAPTIGGIVPMDITVTEATESPVDLSSVVFADVDGDELIVSLTASTGTFTGITGISGVEVIGSGTGELILIGSASTLNNYLDTISNIAYTGVSGIKGDNAASFMIVALDGSLESVESIVNLDIIPFNNTPTVDGIPIDITVIEDTVSPVDLSSVVFADVEGDELTVSLTVDSGTFVATSSAEVIVGGSGSEVLTLSGSVSAINEYLDVTSNIEYTGSSNIAGDNVASFTIVANDGMLDSVVRTVNLDISPVNDAPTIGGIPTDITVTKGVASPVDLSSVIFADVEGDELVVSLTASTGTFAGITGISGVEVIGSGTDELILSGSASTLNSYLDTISNIAYTGASDIEGDNAASFTIVANDGVLGSSISTVNVDITGINDEAQITGDSIGTVEISNIPVILPDGTITSSTNSSDLLSVRGLKNQTITLDNYLTFRESSVGSFGDGNWATESISLPDYYQRGPAPVLMIDFGSTETFNTILVWGYIYFVSNNNSVGVITAKVFNVAIYDSTNDEADEDGFVTVATGLDLENFNAAIAFPDRRSVELSLSESYTTSQVRLTITDNYFGFTSLSYISGVGNRVGLGELVFANLNDTSITGDLNHTDVDVDNADDVWQVVDTATSSIEGYGTYTIDATGNWTYIVNNSNAVANAISTGQELTDSFIVLTEDGTSQLVTVTINNPLFITGTNGADTLIGESGANTIEGLAGEDTLTGGADADTFVYTDTDIGSSNIDTITDFVSGEDKIDLSGVSSLASSPTLTTVSSAIGDGEVLTDDFLAYTNAGTTTLYIDADNDGTFNAANDIQIEFSQGVSLVAGDFVF